MAGATEHGGGRGWSRWRIAGWGVAGLILLAPLVAMQLTDEVQWTAGDFAFAAILLGGVGGAFELAVRKTGDAAYRAAAGVALGAMLLLIWINGAVGLIGSENNDANLMYGGVLAVALIGAVLARFRPRGMALTMVATAVAQATVAAIALGAGLGAPESGPAEIVAVNGFFVALFVASAALFREAAPGARGGGG